MVSYAKLWRPESHSMLPMTREWVAKAESDYDGACEALRSRKKSRRDRICFFSQQCVEKYLQGATDGSGGGFSAHTRVVDPLAVMPADRTGVGRVRSGV